MYLTPQLASNIGTKRPSGRATQGIAEQTAQRTARSGRNFFLGLVIGPFPCRFIRRGTDVIGPSGNLYR